MASTVLPIMLHKEAQLFHMSIYTEAGLLHPLPTVSIYGLAVAAAQLTLVPRQKITL